MKIDDYQYQVKALTFIFFIIYVFILGKQKGGRVHVIKVKSSYDVGQHERVRFLERELVGVVNCAIVSRSDMGNDHTYQEQMRDDCSGA